MECSLAFRNRNAKNSISIDFVKQKLQCIVYSKTGPKMNTFYSKKFLIFKKYCKRKIIKL